MFIVKTIFSFYMIGCLQLVSCNVKKVDTPPNIIYIILDDLGYYEMSCTGNDKLMTPNLDRMDREGMRFTNAFAGAPVCGPSRSTLLTGTHMGHTTVRRNPGGLPLREDDVTIAEVLKKASYATGGFGKWGVGDRGTTGVPEKHGFDQFFGYYHQVHAHTFFPTYLLHNSEKVFMPGNLGDLHKGETFSQYVIYEQTLDFIRTHKDGPFFCYLPYTPPHFYWDIPEDDPSWLLYKDSTWVVDDKNTTNTAQKRATHINMVDRMIGGIFILLKELNIDNNTIVIFSGDNGGVSWSISEKYPNGFFSPNGGRFRGTKSTLYDGGLRVPAIARWPGKIKSGQVNDNIWYFPDIMPTLAEIAGVEAPANTDGISILPTLLGEDEVGRKQPVHEYMYWEYGGGNAVRTDKWKLVKNCIGEQWVQTLPYDSVFTINQNPWELYDISIDEGEQNNLAEERPEIVERLIGIIREAHEPVREGEYYQGGKELGYKGNVIE